VTLSNLHLCLVCSGSKPTDMNKHRCSAPIFLHSWCHVLIVFPASVSGLCAAKATKFDISFCDAFTASLSYKTD